MDETVEPVSNLDGSLTLPPDKSIAHRSAMFAALHEGESVIHNYSPAADPQSTLKCLEGLGVSIERDGYSVSVNGLGRDGFKTPEYDLDCGNSGTTMRLLSGIVGGAGVKARLIGDESLSRRTMKRIIDPLKKMGIQIEAREDNYAPLTIQRNGPVKPMDFDLPIPSAQLKSCVLLAGLFGENPTRVIETIPSRDHTERLLELPVENVDGKRIISSSRAQAIPKQSYTIPGDFSAASFWLVAGSIFPNAKILMQNVGINPTRTAAMHILQKMGATIELTRQHQEGREPVTDLEVKGSELKPVNITPDQVPNCIDEIPILAVAMAFANGTSRIEGAGELRHKETDRIMAVSKMLNAAGVSFTEYEDGLEITGRPDFIPEPARYESFHDHRIAMSAGILSLKADGESRISNAECAAISYPMFWDHLKIMTN